MNPMKGKQRKNPIRLLAVLLSFVLTVTLFPSEMLTVRAAGSTLETDGGAVTWDFTDQDAAIYGSREDGSLSVTGTFEINSGGHGADISNDTVFSLEVPAGQTTLSLGVCSYGSSNALISADGEVLEEEFVLNGAVEDGQESSIQYTSESASTITVEVTGNGYLHYITAETITPPQMASVTGTVTSASGNSADGQTLVFANETGDTAETEIADGSYSISLPIRHVYTVSFENSDVYEITEGATIDLTDASDGAEVTGNISYRVIWDTSKVFSFVINGTTYTVTPGSSSAEDFDMTADGGEGTVELATTNTAIIWADLEGAGVGSLMTDTLENVSENVTYTLSGNTITFTYNDTETSPDSYTIQVKDNSASGTPHANGRTTTYNFGDGSIVSDLYTGDYSITGGASVSSTDGLVTVTGNNRIRYNGSHGIMIGDGDQVSVKVAGNAEIELELCAYSAVGSTITAAVDGEGQLDTGSVSGQAAADGDIAAFTYTGEAATLTFTYNGNGSGYLHSMKVTNELPETQINEQDEMPTADNTIATPVGQQLTLSQEGGSLTTGSELSESVVGYYGFELTDDLNRLEADVVVNSCGSSSSNGVFFGAFNGTDVETIGIRNSTNLGGIYSNADSEVRAGRLDATITEGQLVHFTAEKTADGFVITATPEGGETYTMESSDSDGLFSGNVEDAEISFGFILANASVTVTNMKYYNADDNLLYDQNDCYEAIGTAPVVNSVQAVAADTRDSIIITWNSSELADGDGRYVIQVRKNNSEDWEDVAETTATSYTYPVTEAGTYEFRVGGKLGSEGEVTYCEDTATVADFLPALPTPVVTLEAEADAINISWTASDGATAYEVYRYSSDEGAENPQRIYTTQSVSELFWKDTQVEQEVPYYYYVVAYQYDEHPDVGNVEVNSSNPSETVWAMASAGHTGDYVYEDDAAVITVTDCPEATVFQNTVSISGTVDRAGTISAIVNGTQAAQQTIASADDAFNFNLRVSQGRNEVELLFTDGEGNVTRQTYNFVYLTNYDIVVDASYTGEDGAEVDGMPTYSTVQAAVDSVPADNTERQVIYIKSGDYEERLEVESPYISLIGEDRDGVRIHCYPAELYPGNAGYEAGGDMSLRCATYVKSSAVGFSAENLTFANDYIYGTDDGKSNKSADALRCDADGASFVNVTISGVQDTLYMNSGNQYYYQCRIEGLIDFIYSGDDARALFEDCELVFVYEESHPEGGYICAPRTANGAPYGLIFKDCTITSEEGCVDGTFHLARPWGPDASIYWINCYMGSAINADEPYADMSGNLYTEANFYEYGSYGPGYAVNADRRQLSPTEVETILANLGWNPAELLQATGSSYDGNITEPEPEEPLPEDPKPGTPSGNPDDGNTGSGSDTEFQPGGAGGNGTSSGDKTTGTDKQNSGNNSAENKTADTVATGDNMNMTGWVILLILAGAASVSVLAVRRKRR